MRLKVRFVSVTFALIKQENLLERHYMQMTSADVYIVNADMHCL